MNSELYMFRCNRLDLTPSDALAAATRTSRVVVVPSYPVFAVASYAYASEDD